MLVLDLVGTLLLVDVGGVARHRSHGYLLRVVDDKGGGARRRRPIHRPVRVSAHRFFGEHMEELLGGRRNAAQKFPRAPAALWRSFDWKERPSKNSFNKEWDNGDSCPILGCHSQRDHNTH